VTVSTLASSSCQGIVFDLLDDPGELEVVAAADAKAAAVAATLPKIVAGQAIMPADGKKRWVAFEILAADESEVRLLDRTKTPAVEVKMSLAEVQSLLHIEGAQAASGAGLAFQPVTDLPRAQFAVAQGDVVMVAGAARPPAATSALPSPTIGPAISGESPFDQIRTWMQKIPAPKAKPITLELCEAPIPRQGRYHRATRSLRGPGHRGPARASPTRHLRDRQSGRR